MSPANLSYEDDDIIEIPSCIESLVNSAEQLHQLARYIDEHYIRILLTYGYACESPVTRDIIQNIRLDDISSSNLKSQKEFDLKSFAKDPQVLKVLTSTLRCLPLLSDLTSFIDRCLATIEITLKRSTYHLNRVVVGGEKHNNGDTDSGTGDFRFNDGVKITAILISLMDLFYAIVSLDRTLQTHTSIRAGLDLFKATCQLVQEAEIGSKIPSANTKDELSECEVGGIPADKLRDLIEFVDTIQLTLFKGNQSLFTQVLDHFQHLELILSKDKTKVGFKNFSNQIEEFLTIYGEDLIESRAGSGKTLRAQIDRNSHLLNFRVIPTLHMNSTQQRIFGLLALHAFYSFIFKPKSDKQILKTLTRVLQKSETANLVHLIGSNCHILLNEFISAHTPELGTKLAENLTSQCENSTKMDLNQEFERQTMRVVPWMIKLKTEMTVEAQAESSVDSMERQIRTYEFGLKLASEISSAIKNFVASYLHLGKSMTRQNLIPLLRLVSLLKSIESYLSDYRVKANDICIQIENYGRTKWRKTMDAIQKRLISMRYSERRLTSHTIIILTSICNRIEYLTSTYGRRVMSFSLTMLNPSLSLEEMQTLNNLIDYLPFDELNLQHKRFSDCGHLYWSIQTFDAYYSYAFDTSPCNLDELRYFLSALSDMPNLFQVSGLKYSWSESENALAWLDISRQKFLYKMRCEFLEQFKVKFLDRVCQELEVELRLQTHRDLHMDGHNPFRRHLYNFKKIFASNSPVSFRILDQEICVQYYVEQHLSRVYYNLTAIAPHDWAVYDNMINLARHKYHLKFVNSQLPAQTLDYGLDLLDLIRNLPLFVSRYGYDLINQLFIEKSTNRLSSSASVLSGGGISLLSSSAATSSNQSLNVIQIRHMARSIQTHGFGLLNSAVNCIYQTMKRLINVLSKQMLDDRLQTALSKELQQLSANSSQQNSDLVMPFDRANKMARRFRLSVTSASNSEATSAANLSIDLDSIRQTITQLGNLLAFIRTLKSGALNCASKSVDYVPELDSLSQLRWAKYVEAEFRHYAEWDTLKKASENLDRCLEDYEENFTTRTDYFRIIIDLFTTILSESTETKDLKLARDSSDKCEQASERNMTTNTSSSSELSSQSHGSASELRGVNKPQVAEEESGRRKDHLRLFYLLVPSLTINYIDYIINCRERIWSRSTSARFGALISDDGFSMGVAFLLTVLSQTKDFAKFEWFRQVKRKLREDREEISKRMKDSRYEESLRLTSSVTLRRIDRLTNEYTGLDYTMSSALLFFRSSALEDALPDRGDANSR